MEMDMLNEGEKNLCSSKAMTIFEITQNYGNVIDPTLTDVAEKTENALETEK